MSAFDTQGVRKRERGERKMDEKLGAGYMHSDLFLVRLWVEQGSSGETEWWGWVQRTVSGERLYFSSRASLAEALLEMLPSARSEKSKNPGRSFKGD
jgi:hypothetical protein